MDNYIDVIKRVLELSETLGEGLYYLNDKEHRQDPMELKVLLNDISDAMIAIEASMANIIKHLQLDFQVDYTRELIVLVDEMKCRCEANNYIGVYEILDKEGISMYKNWLKEVQKTFRPYVLS